ncbi:MULTISPECIES: hypothetical protein [unclassified Streptomyces]|uniref:hypothetical protein n=1 Tax=unclassified Streptomyces TaxID=2593676 RepID=UPI0036EDB5CB
MSEQTPSQAEGEREQDTQTDQERDAAGRRDVPRTTPSQAEGESADEERTDEGGTDEERGKAGESGWSGP